MEFWAIKWNNSGFELVLKTIRELEPFNQSKAKRTGRSDRKVFKTLIVLTNVA